MTHNQALAAIDQEFTADVDAVVKHWRKAKVDFFELSRTFHGPRPEDIGEVVWALARIGAMACLRGSIEIDANAEK